LIEGLRDQNRLSKSVKIGFRASETGDTPFLRQKLKVGKCIKGIRKRKGRKDRVHIPF
jgi:hypothetical protein